MDILVVDKLDDGLLSGSKVEARDNLGSMLIVKDSRRILVVTADYLKVKSVYDWCCGYNFDTFTLLSSDIRLSDFSYLLARVRGSTSNPKLPLGIEGSGTFISRSQFIFDGLVYEISEIDEEVLDNVTLLLDNQKDDVDNMLIKEVDDA